MPLPQKQERGDGMIKELDVVTLTRNIPEYGLSKGSHGAVVYCYNDEQAFEVEFVSESGENLALLTLEKADIQAYSHRSDDL